MKLFIDTAAIEEIREVAEWGIIEGVTTNPTLVSKTGRDFKEAVQEICEIISGPVSAEAVSRDRDGMIDEAREISRWANNVVVKIPITEEGIAATSELSGEGTKVNMTLCFSPAQALLAAKAGAAYVSPFVGRLDDIGHDGMAVVADIVHIYSNYDIDTEIIVASVRHPLHVIEAAYLGADIATVPYKVLKQLFGHPLTDKGIELFLRDWGRDRGDVSTRR